MTRVRLALRILLIGLLAGTVGGCGSGSSGAPAAANPPVVPGQAAEGPDLVGVQLPDFVMPLLKGGVSLPRPALTPGDVTTTDANVVCNLPAHVSSPSISFPVQSAVFNAYGYTTPAQQHKYVLDYLVPYDLGGADVQANIWPAEVRGTGFYEKVETDHVLHDMVCRDDLSLSAAQHALETNWYAAWLRYVVASGHI